MGASRAARLSHWYTHARAHTHTHTHTHTSRHTLQPTWEGWSEHWLWCQSDGEEEDTQELFWGPPTCCFNKAQISEPSLGQTAGGGASQLWCPPTRFAAVCEGSLSTLSGFHEGAKGSIIADVNDPNLIWQSLSADIPYTRVSLWKDASLGLRLVEKQEEKFVTLRASCMHTNMYRVKCWINLSTVGCWDATLTMTISWTSGLMIERHSWYTNTRVESVNLKSPSTLCVDAVKDELQRELQVSHWIWC